jgi:hypothetical protein
MQLVAIGLSRWIGNTYEAVQKSQFDRDSGTATRWALPAAITPPA